MNMLNLSEIIMKTLGKGFLERPQFQQRDIQVCKTVGSCYLLFIGLSSSMVDFFLLFLLFHFFSKPYQKPKYFWNYMQVKNTMSVVTLG